MMNEIKLIEDNNIYYVSSKEVAIKFHKEHKNVLQAYRNLVTQLNDNDFTELNFKPLNITRENTIGLIIEDPEIHMTRDGFALLAFGFTGAKALRWKTEFLKAFNYMEAQITSEIPKLRATIRELQAQQKPMLVVTKKEHGNKNTVFVPTVTNTLWGTTELRYNRVPRNDNRYSAMTYKEGELNRLSNLAAGMTKRINELSKELALERRR